MFTFLHELGQSIENEPSPAVLSRIIVDGITKVVTATGGAIYFISDDGKFFIPSYVSEACPPVVPIPAEVWQKAATDARALESHVRLSRVATGEGILGLVLSEGDPIHVQDVRNHPAFYEGAAPPQQQVSAMFAPLRHAGKALGILTVARHANEGLFSENDFDVFVSAAEQSSFAIGNARIYREAHERRAMENELRTAREVQRILLPQGDPVVPGFRISGTNLPARIISGDYYDYIDLGDGRTGIVIADVSGKGVPAGLLMGMCRSALRSIAPGESSPSKALAAVNRQLFPDIREDMFISMAYGILEGTSGRLTLSRAGHDPALCYRKADGSITALRSPGLALGIDSGAVFERVTKDQEVVLASGDSILFYTDGVKEATDATGEEFGIDRMAEAFRQTACDGANAILSSIQHKLKEFTGECAQMDDITLVILEKR